MDKEKIKPDFARIKDIPLEVILLLDDLAIEDEADKFLREEQGLVDADGDYRSSGGIKLVLENPKNPEHAYFRVRVKAKDHPHRPFLGFKYLRGYYQTPEFPGDNPMKKILIATYKKFKDHITKVTNKYLQEVDFPYEVN
jgi:hypothetical protein